MHYFITSLLVTVGISAGIVSNNGSPKRPNLVFELIVRGTENKFPAIRSVQKWMKKSFLRFYKAFRGRAYKLFCFSIVFSQISGYQVAF